MVNMGLVGGRNLINALVGHGYDISAAFWVKPSDEGKWFLYLASPAVDQKGPGEVYRLIHAVLRDAPQWGIDPFDVMAVGVENPMAKAAAEIVKAKVAAGPSGGAAPSILPFNGPSLGRYYVEGAYIYAL
jgi:hypothetical protein